MDVMMPRQDGIEACREFMEKLPWRGTFRALAEGRLRIPDETMR